MQGGFRHNFMFFVVCAAVMCIAFQPCSFGEAVSESARVVDGGGEHSSNSAFRAHASFNQPSPVGYAANGQFLNSAGFLFSDESQASSSADSDQDGLSDWVELSGASSDPLAPSDPLQPDSDGDGVSDFEEIRAGTNPADADSRFEIVDVVYDTSVWQLTWRARGGQSYEVYAADTVDGLTTNPVLLGSVTASGGVGPWRDTVAVYSNEPIDLKFYMIQAPEGR